MKTEKWLDVVGYEGIYEVSSLGRVRRAVDARTGGRKKGSFLSVGSHNRGYRRVYLSKEGRVRLQLVHRLVAFAFLEPPSEEKLVVHHKDGNKQNNCVFNLEWLSYQENSLQAFRVMNCHRARGERVATAKLTDRKVRTIRKMLNAGIPRTKVCAKFSVGKTTVLNIAKGRIWRHV